MIVNALVSSPKIFPFCQTSIFLCEVFSLGEENPLWIWIRLLLPRDLVFSNTNRVPWGKQPVPSQSLGTERQLSSGRYFCLDNSSRIKHLGGRALTCVSVTVPLHSRDKVHIEKMDLEKALLLPLVTCYGVSHQACSRSSSFLSVLCHLPRTSVCGKVPDLWQSPHSPTAVWVHIFWNGPLLGESCVLAVHGSAQWQAKAGEQPGWSVPQHLNSFRILHAAL